MSNYWGLLCDDEDWRMGGWLPPLKNRCCYLMHELAYHSHIREKIFEINRIWVDTKTWDQSLNTLENRNWTLTKWSEDDRV